MWLLVMYMLKVWENSCTKQSLTLYLTKIRMRMILTLFDRIDKTFNTQIYNSGNHSSLTTDAHVRQSTMPSLV